MSAFFLTFLAVALAMLAGREAVRVAQLARAGMPLGGLLLCAAAAGMIGSGLAAWLAGTFAELVAPEYRLWLVAGALGLAALEVLLLAAPAAPREPTGSLGALFLVLLAGVLTDASGLLVLSFSLATGMPAFAAIGGGLAATAVLFGAALAAGDWEKLPRLRLRWGVAVLLAIGAFATLIQAL